MNIIIKILYYIKMTNRKQKGGMGLPSFLLPIGFIVARAAAPKIVRSLKKTFSKQMGGKKRIRTYRKKNKRKTRRLRRQRGGSIESEIEEIYREAGADNNMFQNDVDHMKKHYPGQLHVLLKYAKKSVSDALENTTIALEAKSAKSPKRTKRRTKRRRSKRRTKRRTRRRTRTRRRRTRGARKRGKTGSYRVTSPPLVREVARALDRQAAKKTKDPCCKKRCSCGPGRGSYGLNGPKGECYDNSSYCCKVDRACKNKQKGGFMRGSTRNFCTLNK
jgi:hypothetical protein